MPSSTFLPLIPPTLLLVLLALSTISAASQANIKQDMASRYSIPRRYCDGHYGQLATYHQNEASDSQTTACGEQYDDNAAVAAITTNVENAKAWCGRQIMVTNAEDETYLAILTIKDVTSTGDLGDYGLGLTPAAFNKIVPVREASSEPVGQAKVNWVMLDGDPCI
ncbi:MAG: hypothetical protein M1834_003541 [Cirrosporium novae-zelandiae]|nr:MAG: hypothetical protein M1834_003541 [Cirrosporium novae-zelandiae]